MILSVYAMSIRNALNGLTDEETVNFLLSRFFCPNLAGRIVQLESRLGRVFDRLFSQRFFRSADR